MAERRWVKKEGKGIGTDRFYPRYYGHLIGKPPVIGRPPKTLRLICRYIRGLHKPTPHSGATYGL